MTVEDQLHHIAQVGQFRTDPDDYFRALARESAALIGLLPPTPTAAEWLLVRNRPELGLFFSDIYVRFEKPRSAPFVVHDWYRVTLDPGVLMSPSLGAFHLRHAFELVLLSRQVVSGTPRVQSLVRAVLAAHTAAQYFELMVYPAKQSVASELPSWCQELLGNDGGSVSARELFHRLYGHRKDLIALQSRESTMWDALSGEETEAAVALVEGALKYAYPVEALLTLGGDARLKINDRTGLNQYGCSPRPRPWAITFSSCTASSISDGAYRNAEIVRRRLLAHATAGDSPNALWSELDHIRSELADLFELSQLPDTEVIFAASGTDVELFALHVALERAKEAKFVLNILIGPDEIGSGSKHAAAGRHFCNITPSGRVVREAENIDGVDCARIRVFNVDLRDAVGHPISGQQMDNLIETQVAAAIEDGGIVLLHLLDSSKTELSAPSRACAIALKERYHDKLIVLVDAAQMRLDIATLHEYLHAEFMVMITGSKFFTAPPFAGALLVPRETARTIDCSGPLPVGYKDYVASTDFPSRWQKLTVHLDKSPNLGLLLRWSAGIWEMAMFKRVPLKRRLEVIKRFGAAIADIMQANPDVARVEGGKFGKIEAADWHELPTVFSFQVFLPTDGGGHAAASYEEARTIYRLLNADISPLLADEVSERARTLGAKRCHVGQPVQVCKDRDMPVSALRVAAGVRYVYGVEYDVGLGENRDIRLASELRDLRTVFDKISLIARYWSTLRGADLSLASPRPPDYSF